MINHRLQVTRKRRYLRSSAANPSIPWESHSPGLPPLAAGISGDASVSRPFTGSCAQPENRKQILCVTRIQVFDKKPLAGLSVVTAGFSGSAFPSNSSGIYQTRSIHPPPASISGGGGLSRPFTGSCAQPENRKQILCVTRIQVFDKKPLVGLSVVMAGFSGSAFSSNSSGIYPTRSIQPPPASISGGGGLSRPFTGSCAQPENRKQIPCVTQIQVFDKTLFAGLSVVMAGFSGSAFSSNSARIHQTRKPSRTPDLHSLYRNKSSPRIYRNILYATLQRLQSRIILKNSPEQTR